MLNLDKDRKLLFQCGPFSNQWPVVFGNVIQAGVGLVLTETQIETERVKVREWSSGQLRPLTFTSAV